MPKYKITDNQTRLLSDLSRVGCVSKKNIFTHTGVNAKGLSSLVNQGLIIKTEKINSNASNDIYYKFSSTGKAYAQKHIEDVASKFYSAQSVNHDAKLQEYYYSLSQTEKQTWRTEQECRDLLQEQINLMPYSYEKIELQDKLNNYEISPPDCYVQRDNGEIEVYEVITDSYGKQDIEKKIEFCNALNIDNLNMSSKN